MALDDKYDGLQRLVQMGKEKGYVLYDEVSEVLPGDLAGRRRPRRRARRPRHRRHRNPRRAQGFREEDRRSRRRAARPRTSRRDVGEKVNDPVRMYLREMGTVPLLTREGEVEIARRIERGQNTVLKSLFRAPLVIQEIIGMGEEVAAGHALRARRHPDRRPHAHRRTGGGEAAGVRRAAPRTWRGTTRRSCSAARSCRPFRAA